MIRVAGYLSNRCCLTNAFVGYPMASAGCIRCYEQHPQYAVTSYGQNQPGDIVSRPASIPISIRHFQGSLLPELVVKASHVIHRNFSVDRSAPPTSPSFVSSSPSEFPIPPVTPVSYTASSSSPSPASATHRYHRHDIEDSVMGVLSRYTNRSIKDLELTTRLVDLETLSGHDPSCENFFPNTKKPSSTDTSSAASSMETGSVGDDGTVHLRRMWDCLDTVEFVLDVERVFNLEIPDAVADAVETPEDAVNAVYSLLVQAGKVQQQDR